MSGFLDQKLAALKISADGQQTPKKVGPAVPPKPKKPQPQVILLTDIYLIISILYLHCSFIVKLSIPGSKKLCYKWS